MSTPLLDITKLGDYIGQSSVSGAGTVLEPLIIFIVGMLVYTVFIHKFYRFIAKKDIFKIKTSGEKAFSKIVYGLKYIFLFPIVAFVWFFVIAMLLSVLSTVLTVTQIFLISMAITSTIRLAAHYDEDLSKDIAKLIPFAMLGVFLLEITVINASVPLQIISELGAALGTMAYYFGFLVVLELILKGLSHSKFLVGKKLAD